MVRHITFRALFAPFLILNIKLQYVCGEGNLAQAWAGGGERGFSQAPYCIVQGLRGMETMPLGWEPQWVRAWDWEGEKDHFLCIWETPRGTAVPIMAKNQIRFFFHSSTSRPTPPPSPCPKLLAKPRHCPQDLHGEVQGSFRYGWLMNLIMVSQADFNNIDSVI